MARITDFNEKRSKGIGNAGLMVFQISLFAFLSTSSYGLGDDEWKAQVALVGTLIVGGAVYVLRLRQMRARNINNRDLYPLTGLGAAALVLPALSLSSLSGWWGFSLSIMFQAMSLICGGWASARLRYPRSGEGEGA